MKIRLIDNLKIVMSNSESLHDYFAWPSAVRLKNGRIAIAASGFRLSHICPFGKTVIAFSEDDGETYTPAAPVIDTVLDDRDAGLCTFGKSGLIITSFNNTVDYQREIAISRKTSFWKRRNCDDNPYRLGYLDLIDEQTQNKYLGSTFRISYDNGVTWSKIYKSPITSPHGPVECKDGTVIWVGRTFDARETDDCIAAYTINTANGEMQYVGRIDNISVDGHNFLSCEPHTVELSDGTLLCHIRVQYKHDGKKNSIFTIFESKSSDGGKTWTKPVQLLDDLAGSPPHILVHSSGTLVCTYARREEPCGIRVMFSRDNAKTWDTEHILYENGDRPDLGYPASVELNDGSIMTIFYDKYVADGPTVILQQKWTFKE